MKFLCNNPLGIKGAGEAGAIGAPPAVINAICNALNIDHIDMPAKPEKVWQILSNKKSNYIIEIIIIKRMLLPMYP